MKICTEFLTLHEDGAMPKEDIFLPSVWSREDFDIDGDYYYEGIGGRWTNLEINCEEDCGSETQFELHTFREKNRNYEPSILEARELSRFVNYRNEGRYSKYLPINVINDLCVTSMYITTKSLKRYSEFQLSMYAFLKHSGGMIVNCGIHDADSFNQTFILD